MTRDQYLRKQTCLSKHTYTKPERLGVALDKIEATMSKETGAY